MLSGFVSEIHIILLLLKFFLAFYERINIIRYDKETVQLLRVLLEIMIK